MTNLRVDLDVWVNLVQPHPASIDEYNTPLERGYYYNLGDYGKLGIFFDRTNSVHKTTYLYLTILIRSTCE